MNAVDFIIISIQNHNPIKEGIDLTRLTLTFLSIHLIRNAMTKAIGIDHMKSKKIYTTKKCFFFVCLVACRCLL